jgi:hypothetical protein
MTKGNTGLATTYLLTHQLEVPCYRNFHFRTLSVLEVGKRKFKKLI